jgi:hypothetical protein
MLFAVTRPYGAILAWPPSRSTEVLCLVAPNPDGGGRDTLVAGRRTLLSPPAWPAHCLHHLAEAIHDIVAFAVAQPGNVNG